FILKGIGATLQFVSVSILVGFVLGALLALCKITHVRPLKWLADAYTSIFRGTPLILQLMIIYYAISQLFEYDISAFLSAVLAFGLNSAAYVSEIIRAGILAEDNGQTKATQTLGFSYPAMMIHLILPQDLKHVL